MTCSCIEEIDAKLEEHKLDIAVMYSRERNTLEACAFSALIRKDTGNRETRRRKPTVFAATFCPFCGKRYDPEATDVAA